MKIERGDITVGDIGVQITVTVDETLTGKNIDFEFLKPSGATIVRDASSLSGYTATYITASGDIDESGEWRLFLYNATSGFYYTEEGVSTFYVRPKPAEMARS